MADNDLFTTALVRFREGDLEVAERLLTESLRKNPEHFDSLHLLAHLSARRGRAPAAVALLRIAVRLNPAHAGAWGFLGNLLFDMGVVPESIEAFSRALELRPDIREGWLFRARAYQHVGRLSDSLADLDRAIALGADDANTYVSRAGVLLRMGRPGDAAESCRLALARQPELTAAHVNFAGALYLTNDMAGAIEAARAALALSPADPTAHAYLGAALLQSRDLGPALSHLDRAIELDQNHAMAYSTRALCLMHLGRAQDAYESCQRAIALQPDRADAYNTRGLLQADAELALKDFDKALSLQPDLIEPRFNKGVVLLQRGEYRAGWELYESRPKPSFRGVDRDRLWNGSENLVGKTLLTHSEQGLGDTIQFSRYAKSLAARGARVVLRVQDCLRELFSDFDPNITIIGQGDPLPDFDRHVPLLSLPRIFGTTADNIPLGVPYLRARQDRIAKWRARLGEHSGRRIGIRWQGSLTKADLGRSFRLQEFAPIAALDDVQLVSLQKDAGTEQLLIPRDWPVTVLGDDFEADERHAFLDVAALMQLFDLIITSDTSIAHLAGALGRPVWVAIKHRPDWRWLLERDDNPWYPSMRLFRQPSPGDWAAVFDGMRSALAR